MNWFFFFLNKNKNKISKIRGSEELKEHIHKTVSSTLGLPLQTHKKEMAVVRTTTNLILRGIFNPAPPSSFSLSRFSGAVRVIGGSLRYTERGISFSRIRCAAASDGKKVSSRLSQVQQLLQEAEDRALSADNQPTPKITLGISFSLFLLLLISTSFCVV